MPLAIRIDIGDWTELTVPEKAVLADCINGSTWMATMKCVESDAKIAAHARLGEKLAEKVQALTGIECTFPTY